MRAIPGDVADPAHREQLVAAVVAAGRLDLLINNASDLGGSPLPRLRDLEPEAYEQLLRTNVIAPQQLIRALLPLLHPQTVIINVSSDAGVEHYETWGGYGSSKAALDHQTLTWAEEEPDLQVVQPRPWRHAHRHAAGGVSGRGHQRSHRARDGGTDRRGADWLSPAQRSLPSCRADRNPRRQSTLAMSTMLAARPNTHFASPEDHTATEPPELRGLRRDGVRLMVATPAGIRHTFFHRLGDQLSAGDVLVVNTSATVPGQLDGNRDGSAVVVHIANRLGDGTRVVELRTAPDASAPVLDGRVGEDIRGSPSRRRERGKRSRARCAIPNPTPRRLVSGIGSGADGSPCRNSLSDYLREHARPISYGYLNGSFPISAYQTIFALCPGSAEMPSAARPFSAELVARLVARGVIFAPITLAHRLVLPRCGRGPAARVVRGQRDDRPSGQLEPGAWRPGDRGRHHGDPRHRVSSPAGRDGGSRLRMDRPGDLSGAPGTRGRRADHRMAQPGGVSPAAGRVGCRRRADPARVRRGRCRALSLARIRRDSCLFF